MKIKRHNVFLVLFVISYVAVSPFVFMEMYNNSGFGKLPCDITGTSPAEGSEIATDSTENTTTDDVTDSEKETVPEEETTSEQETMTEKPISEPPKETTPEMPAETTSQTESESTTNNELPTEKETSAEGGRKPQFMTVEPSYFDDALFIGDSRTVGIYEYGVLDCADFFCDVGMSVYNVHKTEVSIPAVGKISLTNLLKNANYGKIYIMLGMNELGYNFNKTVSRYGELINEIRSMQPNAIIYIQANLHVTKKRSDSDAVYNNQAINRFNSAVADYADNENIFYIDVNTLFDDEDGNLNRMYTNDNTHPLARYYTEWSKWLCDMAIIR